MNKRKSTKSFPISLRWTAYVKKYLKKCDYSRISYRIELYFTCTHMTWDGMRPRVSEKASYRLLGSDGRRYSSLQVGGQGSVGVSDNWRPAVGYPCNNNTTAGESHHFSPAAAAAGPGRRQQSRLHRQYRTVNYMHELWHCSPSIPETWKCRWKLSARFLRYSDLHVASVLQDSPNPGVYNEEKSERI